MTKWFQRRQIKQTTPFLTPLGLLFFVCTSDQPLKKPFNFHRIIQWTFLPSLVPIIQVVSEKTIITNNTLFDTFGPLFLVLLIIKKTHWILNEPSNEHSYQVCFQLAQWFQRRPLHFFQHLGLWFFCVLLINKKPIHFSMNDPMNIPTKFVSNWLSGFRGDH